MAKNKCVDFMISFVQEYLDGKNDRYFFDLDFNHYLIEHYPGMDRFNRSLAECFVFYLSEEGFDRSEGLSDGEHKKLFRRQFKKFMDTVRDGFW